MTYQGPYTDRPAIRDVQALVLIVLGFVLVLVAAFAADWRAGLATLGTEATLIGVWLGYAKS